MPEVLLPLSVAALALLLGVAGAFHLRRSHREQIDRLSALHKRQLGASSERLADAQRRSELLRQEVLLLKKEIVRHQGRWDRYQALNARPATAAVARPDSKSATRDERWEDESGFADTQPWERDFP